jgi:short-chain Z-isoprenyl diphosphate synthase
MRAAYDAAVTEQAGAGIRPAARRRRGRLARLRRRGGPVLLAPAYSLYTRRLRAQVRAAPLPQHVAVILDGNRRWATAVGLSEPGAGHRHGADKLDELRTGAPSSIGELTVWATLGREPRAHGRRARRAARHPRGEAVRAVGARPRSHPRSGASRRSPALAATVRRVEDATRGNGGLCLNVALGYSGRDELVDATRSLIRSLAAGGASPDEMAARVDAAAIERHLYTADPSDPDLIVRTSGEMRLSGFLPWQSSHSEFYFTDVYWPAFRELDFLRAVRTYQQRERRFGR